MDSITRLTEEPRSGSRGGRPIAADPFPEAGTVTQLLLKAFIVGGVPFRFLENPYLALQLLNQQYQVPSRKVLVRGIDPLHAEIDALKRRLVNHKDGSISTDGATMHGNTSFRNCFFVTEPEAHAVHIATVDLQERSKEATALTAELETWAKRVQDMGGVVHGATTDNASAEVLSAAQVEASPGGAWFPHVGCKEHACELLLEDILGTSKKPAPAELRKVVEPIEQALEISQYFLLRPRLKALHFRGMQEAAAFRDLPAHHRSRYYLHHKAKVHASKVLVANRVMDIQDITRYLCRHRLFMQRASQGDRARGEENAALLHGDNGRFDQRLASSLKVLNPILVCLRKLDCTSSLLCTVLSCWHDMEVSAGAAFQQLVPHVPQHVDFFEAVLMGRRDKHIGDLERVAYLPQPKVIKASTLETFTAEEQTRLQRVFARARLPPADGLKERQELISKSGPYAAVSGGGEKSVVWQNVARMRPLSWFQLHVKKEMSPVLLALAKPLLTMKSSQAVSERGWSALDWLSGSRRKRLGAPCLLRMVDIAWWLNKTHARASAFCDASSTDDEDLSESPEEQEAQEAETADLLGEAEQPAAQAALADAHAAAARVYTDTLIRARERLALAGGSQKLSAPLARPWLLELLACVVTRRTLIHSKIVPAVAPYTSHDDVDIRVLASRIKAAWREIYGGRTQGRTALEVEKLVEKPPEAAEAPRGDSRRIARDDAFDD
ncbi:unnamed protein product [Prorocentrum cordatum]|uniref:TFIIS N-terminal domain-containing protein n=1 Tax=Prorocentrum cordatum TaxID=2364126 RepID=A0ABN9UTH7_9DINO|nr:unnamed protein product [Polarella glacialis]